MPKGIYQRKPGQKRKVGLEAKNAFAVNAKKARAVAMNSPKAKAAKVRNAGKACSVRTARSILKHLPLGVRAGDVVNTSKYRKLTVIDPAPVEHVDKTGRTEWEQKFSQHVKIKIYGSVHEASGPCRIVWPEKPTLENILVNPMFEEADAGGNAEFVSPEELRKIMVKVPVVKTVQENGTMKIDPEFLKKLERSGKTEKEEKDTGK